MIFPVKADELIQFLYSWRWISTCILDFLSFSNQLSGLMDTAYAPYVKWLEVELNKISLFVFSFGATVEKAN